MTEYAGRLGGTLADGVETATRTIGIVADALRDAEPTTWAVIGVVAFLLWLVFRR